MGPPRGSWLSGESGGSGRPNNNGVVGQCDPLAEREVYVEVWKCGNQKSPFTPIFPKKVDTLII